MTTYYKNKNRGYIALMATIIISLVLLVMVTQEGFSGWYSRFIVLGTEAKEQANALAEGCADQALASLITDVTYTGNTDSTMPAGTCHVYPVELNTPQNGMVTIKTQAVVNHAYANLALATNLNSVHVGAIPSAPQYGTLIVQTLVTNTAGGPQKAPSDFTMHVASVNPSKSVFAGASTGVVVTIPTPTSAAVNYSVTQDAVPGYAPSMTAQCNGSIHGGEIKSCTVSNAPVTTTLTLIANVSNTYGITTAQPADIPLYIDGTQVTLGHAYTQSVGTHSVTATIPSGYSASSWGFQCSGVAGSGSAVLDLGNNKICIINLAENAPPAPICADTVMMLDRSGSMFDNSQWIPDEKAAANALVDLYASVPVIHPLVGFGRFGDASRTGAEIVQHLQNTYAALKTAITNGLPDNNSYTNLADAITKGDEELNGSYHTAGNQKVLVLISDGEPNQPTGTTAFATPYVAPASNAQNATGELWSNPAGIYADGGTDASDPVSENNRHRFSDFNLPAIPAVAAIAGIEAKVDAWATDTSVSTPTALFTDTFGTSNTSNMPSPWSETGGFGSDTTILGGNSTSNPAEDRTRDGSSTNKFVRIGEGEWVCRTVDAAGYQALILKYYWKGDSDAESSDQGIVEYRSSGSCSNSTGWSSVATHALNNTAWSGQQTISLPVALNNDNFLIRFRANSNSTNENFRVDDVSVSGTAMPAVACQVGMDLSWNGGTNWSSEKTQTLTGTEATYTLGGSSDKWGSHTWVPADFTNTNFRARLRAIDPGTSCSNTGLDHADYLQLRVHYTQTTDPSNAALAAADAAKLNGTKVFTIHFGDAAGRPLLAQLASGNTTYAGHQNGSYSDPGGVTTGDTGYVSPTAQAVDTGGDNNGFESNPTNAFADGSGAATNNNGAGDRHRYYGYGINVPPGATIVGIQTRLDWWLDSTSGTNSMGVELSWNGGTSWTSAKSSTDESTNTSNTDTVGGTTDTWGRTWSSSDFSSANFRVRLTSNSSVSTRDFSLDWVPVRVYYSVNQENGDGDNFFIAPNSSDMKGIFEFIGNQVCPAANNPATAAAPTTASLFVMTRIINNNNGTSVPGDFRVSVNGQNVSPATFTGLDSPGKQVTLDPGAYSITQTTIPSGYTQSMTDSCSSGASGTIAAGESRVCIITNDDIPPPPPPPDLSITPGSWQEVPKTGP